MTTFVVRYGPMPSENTAFSGHWIIPVGEDELESLDVKKFALAIWDKGLTKGYGHMLIGKTSDVVDNEILPDYHILYAFFAKVLRTKDENMQPIIEVVEYCMDYQSQVKDPHIIRVVRIPN